MIRGGVFYAQRFFPFAPKISRIRPHPAPHADVDHRRIVSGDSDGVSSYGTIQVNDSLKISLAHLALAPTAMLFGPVAAAFRAQ